MEYFYDFYERCTYNSHTCVLILERSIKRFFFYIFLTVGRFAFDKFCRTREFLRGSAGHRRRVLQRTGDHGQTGRTSTGRRDEKSLRQRYTDAGNQSDAKRAQQFRTEFGLHKRQFRQSTYGFLFCR